MAKSCPEEFNPWPPFVDIFASVILVLMLFLLITVVNIGYYAQFKSKMSYTAEVTKKAPQDTEGTIPSANTCVPCKKVKIEDKQEEVSFHKISKPAFENSENSLFSGGEAEGNSVDYKSKTKTNFDSQDILLKNRSLEIFFKDKEVFISTQIKHKIKKFVGDMNRISTKSTFTIFIHDPESVISATISKQISLGRVLNIKNIIKKTKVNKSRIKINLQTDALKPSAYGSLVIKAQMP
jgi:hypothetical protein